MKSPLPNARRGTGVSLYSAAVKRPTQREPPAPPQETRESILAAIRQAAQPLKPAQLAKLAGMPKKLTGPGVVRLLGPDLTQDGIFNWGSEKAPVYWHLDQTALARERLLAAAASEVLTAAQLTTKAANRLPKLKPALVKSVQAALVQEKLLWNVKNKIRDRKQVELYLESEIAGILKSCGWERPASRIQALLSDSPQTASDESVQDVAEKMFAAMNRIAFSPGTTVTFYRLRQQPELAHIPKPVFDEAALLLQRERRALLSLHDHASALPPEERERFVTDGLGTYYVSIYSR